MLQLMSLGKTVRSVVVPILFAGIGALVFYVSSLVSGDWNTVWAHKGTIGALFWAYEHASFFTIGTLFILAFACAWMPFSPLLAAFSLGLFYPIAATVEIVAGTHTGNILPLEFLGYLFILGICLFGYALGRSVLRHVTGTASKVGQ
jgi:hypothetical protein